MATLDAIPKTYDEAVRTLAAWHRADDLPDLEVFSFADPDGQVVRLLEVSDYFPATGQVIAYPFGRSAQFPFKSVVAQITRAEWSQIQTHGLPLPSGWDLAAAERVLP